MRKLILFLILSLPGLVSAQVKTESNSLVLKNVSVIDMVELPLKQRLKDSPLKKDMTVVVIGRRIEAIGKNGKVRIPKNARVIDARGKFLIPGLWDMHVHLFNNISGDGTNNSDRYFPLFIANGVTGVRDMWTDADDLRLVREWQAEIEAGRMIGPRIAAGSSIVDGVPTHLPNMLGVATADEARALVRKLKEQGAGFVKVYWNLKPDVYAAIADEAKKVGIVFAGHVPFALSAAQVSDAGQKSIEHMTGILEGCSSREAELSGKQQTPAIVDELWNTYSDMKCRDLFLRFAKNETWQTPTAVLHRMLALRREEDFRKDERLKYATTGEREEWTKIPDRPPVWTLETRKNRLQRILSTVHTMQQMAVPVLAGTDLGNPFIFAGSSLHDELELFVQGEIEPLEALKTATFNPAKYLGKLDSYGTVEKGKIADLVLLDANPLEEIGNTRLIFAVILNGKYLAKDDLQKMSADVEKSLNKK